MRLSAATFLMALAIALPACGAAATGPTDAAVPQPSARDAAELYAEGRNAASRGDSVRAEQYLSLAVEHGFSLDRALPLLLEVCLSNSRLRAALNHADPYLRNHPQNTALRYLVATIHLGLGEDESARLELEQLLRDAPRDSDAHYLLGVLDQANHAESAREHFRAYLATAPTGRRANDVRGRLSELAVREPSWADVPQAARRRQRH